MGNLWLCVCVCDAAERGMIYRRWRTCEIPYTSKQLHNVSHWELLSNRIMKLLVLKGLRINKKQNKKKNIAVLIKSEFKKIYYYKWTYQDN